MMNADHETQLHVLFRSAFRNQVISFDAGGGISVANQQCPPFVQGDVVWVEFVTNLGYDAEFVRERWTLIYTEYYKLPRRSFLFFRYINELYGIGVFNGGLNTIRGNNIRINNIRGLIRNIPIAGREHVIATYPSLLQPDPNEPNASYLFGSLSFVNHACINHRNCSPYDRHDFDGEGVPFGDWVVLHSLRDIAPQQELTVHYLMENEDDSPPGNNGYICRSCVP